MITGKEFTDDEMTLECVQVPDGWEDVNSSASVYRTSRGLMARGDWVSMTATESVTFVIKEGFSTTKTSSTKVSQEFNLSYEITEGVKFGPASESSTLSESYKFAIEQDTSESMTKDISV